MTSMRPIFRSTLALIVLGQAALLSPAQAAEDARSCAKMPARIGATALGSEESSPQLEALSQAIRNHSLGWNDLEKEISNHSLVDQAKMLARLQYVVGSAENELNVTIERDPGAGLVSLRSTVAKLSGSADALAGVAAILSLLGKRPNRWQVTPEEALTGGPSLGSPAGLIRFAAKLFALSLAGWAGYAYVDQNIGVPVDEALRIKRDLKTIGRALSAKLKGVQVKIMTDCLATINK